MPRHYSGWAALPAGLSTAHIPCCAHAHLGSTDVASLGPAHLLMCACKCSQCPLSKWGNCLFLFLTMNNTDSVKDLAPVLVFRFKCLHRDEWGWAPLLITLKLCIISGSVPLSNDSFHIENSSTVTLQTSLCDLSGSAGSVPLCRSCLTAEVPH